MQFFSQLQDKIHSGEFIPINDAQNDYEIIMKQHRLQYVISRKVLKAKIQQHITDVEFTRPINRAKPSLIHSTKACNATVSEVAHQSDQEKV